MRTLLLPIMILATTASGQGFLGYSDQAVILGDPPPGCGHAGLVYNYDGHFENGVMTQYEAVVPPYYGAFGEGYDLGEGIVFCAAYWLTENGNFSGQTADCYLWEGGVHSPPDAVLAMVAGVVFDNIPLWPEIGLNEVEMNVSVSGEFTVGYWGNWPGDAGGFYCAFDANGPRTHPWMCIAPGIMYPDLPGWHDPWYYYHYNPPSSMGCGAVFGQSAPSGLEEDAGMTWGAIKALFGKEGS